MKNNLFRKSLLLCSLFAFAVTAAVAQAQEGADVPVEGESFQGEFYGPEVPMGETYVEPQNEGAFGEPVIQEEPQYIPEAPQDPQQMIPVEESQLPLEEPTVEEDVPQEYVPVWADVPAEQLDVLREVYSKMTDPAKARSGWFLSEMPEVCFWNGLACENGQITSLTLKDAFTFSVFPEEILALESLKELHLTDTFIFGPLPQNFFEELPDLEVLELKGNFLTGPIPELQDGNKLRELVIADNMVTERKQQLVQLPEFIDAASVELKAEDYRDDFENLDLNPGLDGALPLELTRCVKLQKLDLSGNLLSGNVPDEYMFLPIFSFDLRENAADFAVSQALYDQLASRGSEDIYLDNLIPPTPTEIPTEEPTAVPTELPTDEPTPTELPTEIPTETPVPTATTDIEALVATQVAQYIQMTQVADQKAVEDANAQATIIAQAVMQTQIAQQKADEEKRQMEYVQSTQVAGAVEATRAADKKAAEEAAAKKTAEAPKKDEKKKEPPAPIIVVVTSTPQPRWYTPTPYAYNSNQNWQPPQPQQQPQGNPQQYYQPPQPQQQPQYNQRPQQNYQQPNYYQPQTQQSNPGGWQNNTYTRPTAVPTATAAPTVYPGKEFAFTYVTEEMTLEDMPMVWRHTGMNQYMMNYLDAKGNLYPAFAMEWTPSSEICNTTNCAASVNDIPQDLLEGGKFSIQLQGRDSDGIIYHSDPVEMIVQVPEVPETPEAESGSQNVFARFFGWLFGPILRVLGIAE